MLVTRRWLLVLILVSAFENPLVTMAAGAPEVSRGILKILSTDLTQGTLQGLVSLAEGLGLASPPSAIGSQGTYTSPVLKLDFEAVHLGLHWSAEVPPGAEILIEIRGRPLAEPWSSWSRLEGQLGSDHPETPQNKKHLFLSLYPAIFSEGILEIQVRAKISVSEKNGRPILKEIHIYYSDPRSFLIWVEDQRQRRNPQGKSKKNPFIQ